MKETIAAVAVTLALTCTPAYAQDTATAIRFDGQSFEPPSSDLFGGRASLSPGDTFSTRISIENDSDRVQVFFLSLEDPESLSAKEQTLLEAATLTVESAGSGILYEGPLSATNLREGIELDACDQGKSIELRVEISAPQELDNSFAMSNDLLHWRFWAVPEEAYFQGAFMPVAGAVYDKTGYDLTPYFAAGAALAVVGAVAFTLGKRR